MIEKNQERTTLVRRRTMATSNVDWDLLRVFLALMRANTLREAAAALGTSHPTVRRKLHALETQLGVVKRPGFFGDLIRKETGKSWETSSTQQKSESELYASFWTMRPSTNLGG